MAGRKRTGTQSGTWSARPLRGRRSSYHGLAGLRLRHFSDRPLGLHVLARSACPKSARSFAIACGRKEQACESRNVARHWLFNRRQFPRWLARANVRLSHSNRFHIPRLLPRNAWRILCASRSFRFAVVVSAHWRVPGRLRPVHDVFAAALSNALAHDRRRILLQYWQNRDRIWCRLLRSLFEGRRSSRRVALRWLSLFARGRRFPLPAGHPRLDLCEKAESAAPRRNCWRQW